MKNKYYHQQIDAFLKEGYQIEVETSSGTSLSKPVKIKWFTCFISSPILVIIWTILMTLMFGWAFGALASFLGFVSSLVFCSLVVIRDISKQKSKKEFVSKIKT